MDEVFEKFGKYEVVTHNTCYVVETMDEVTEEIEKCIEHGLQPEDIAVYVLVGSGKTVIND